VDNSIDYLWTCEGFNGGSKASCSSKKPTDPNSISGLCGVNRNTCLNGFLFDLDDNSTQYIWECRGSGSGSTMKCSQNISSAPVNAICSSALNTCTQGTFSDLPDTDSGFQWSCIGTNGGTSKTCNFVRPTCALDVSPVTHVGQNKTLKILVGTGQLPTKVRVKLYGTKSPLNSNNPAVDADGGSADTFELSAPYNNSLPYNNGTLAGQFTRYAVVYTAENEEIELCKTASVSFSLTPACGLTVSSSSIQLGNSYSFSASFPANAEQPALSGVPSSIMWYETKTYLGSEVTIQNGNKIPVSSFNPIAFQTTQTTQTELVGNYTRHYIAYDVNNRPLCRSNSVNYSLTAPVNPNPNPNNPPGPREKCVPPFYNDCSK
jgi:hypothetical protein